MKISLGEIATLLKGECVGDPHFVVSGCGSLETAKQDELSFLHSNQYLAGVENSSARALLVTKTIALPKTKKNFVLVENARLSFIQMQNHFYPPKKHSGQISPEAICHPSATIGKNVTLYPFVFVDKNAKIEENSVVYPHSFIGENAKIGSNCLIYSNCSILDCVILGNSVIIHSGTMIGCDGFGFETEENIHYKMPHRGSVKIGDEVEIGANCTIDRGVVEDTSIGKGTKIDNLVHLAHNVRIGENCLIAGQVGIAGSSHLGNQVYCGGQVGILGHNNIGDNSIFHPGSIFMHEGKTIPEKSDMAGIPAIPTYEWRKNIVLQKKLVFLEKRLRNLEKKILPE